MARSRPQVVSFSGPDGSGKSTQIELLAEHLRQMGQRPLVLWTRLGYTPGFELAKSALRKTEQDAHHHVQRVARKPDKASPTQSTSLSKQQPQRKPEPQQPQRTPLELQARAQQQAEQLREQQHIERLTSQGLKDLPVKIALAGVLPDRKSLQPRELLLVSAQHLMRPALHRVEPQLQHEPREPMLPRPERAWAPRQPQQPRPLEVELIEPAPATRKVRIQVQVKHLSARPRLEDGEAAAHDEQVVGDHSAEYKPDAHAIAQAVARVLPYVYWDWPRRGQILGRTVVRFKLNADGYVDDASVISSTGNVRLGRESGEALTLASPYEFVPGWIELTLTFKG